MLKPERMWNTERVWNLELMWKPGTDVKPGAGVKSGVKELVQDKKVSVGSNAGFIAEIPKWLK